ALARLGRAVPLHRLPQNLTGLASGVIGQHAWNLLVAGTFAHVIGSAMNWHNSRIGYWLNLGVVSAVDVGYICAILLPGYVTFIDGGLGPVLWVLAAIFSAVGFYTHPGDERRPVRA